MGHKLQPKDSKYWNLVRYRIEKLQNQIRASQVREQVAEARLPPPGSPPFEYRPAFIMAGWRPVSGAEEAEARELFRRRHAMRRTEPIKIGSFWFGRTPHSSVEEYASGVFRLEMQTACALVRDGRGIWVQRSAGHERMQADGYRVESLPDELMLEREDRELLARILA